MIKFLTGFFFLSLFFNTSAYTVDLQKLPSSPGSHFYLETQSLESFVTKEVQVKITQTFQLHEANAGDQIVFAVFESLSDTKGNTQDPITLTNQIFKKWAIGQYGKNNGALLAVYLKERKIRLEVGYGLEPLLTDAKSKRIINEILQPYFKSNQAGVGFTAAAYSILETLESPILNTENSLLKPLPQKKQRQISSPLSLGVIFLIIIILNLVNRITSRSTTYYSRNHSRHTDSFFPFPISTHRRRNGMGGPFGGGGGGLGGFLGGGGRSGGGGASGSW